MDAHLDEPLGLSDELGGEDGDGGGPVADLVVLDAGHVDEDLGRGVVDPDRLQDRRAVIGHLRGKKDN